MGGYGQISPTDPSLALICPCVRYNQITFHNSSSRTRYHQSMEAGVSSTKMEIGDARFSEHGFG